MLSDAIQQMDLSPIKVKLMSGRDRDAWTEAKVSVVESIYRQFLQLNLTYPRMSIVPTEDVDEFWHCHILDTMKYAEDCDRIFGHLLHHFPYFGMRSDQDAADLQNAFAATKKLFLAEFGTSLDVGSAANCEDCAPVQPGPTVDDFEMYARPTNVRFRPSLLSASKYSPVEEEQGIPSEENPPRHICPMPQQYAAA